MYGVWLGLSGKKVFFGGSFFFLAHKSEKTIIKKNGKKKKSTFSPQPNRFIHDKKNRLPLLF